MKLLVSAQRLQIGGTQTNAIEMAAALRDQHGFDVVFWAASGPMVNLVRQKKLRYVEAPDVRVHPSLSRMKALERLLAKEKPDLIHAWDWWQGLDAYLMGYLAHRVPLLVSDMMLELTRVLPTSLPTTFGTPMVVDAAAKAGWHNAHLLLPPVDIDKNAPGIVDGSTFRRAIGLENEDIAIVVISRLAVGKTESITQAIEVVRDLPQESRLRLVVVGDGSERGSLEQIAAKCNAHLGRRAVILTGSIIDPRPAYAAADIVIGMGGSALRGMAFAKPVIIVGEPGFAKVFSPYTRAAIHSTGMYGWRDLDPSTRRLKAALTELATMDSAARFNLGQFGREYVVSNYSLDVVTEGFARLCRAAAQVDRSPLLTEAWSFSRCAYYYLRERRFWSPSRDLHPHDEVVTISNSSAASSRNESSPTAEVLGL